MAEIWTIGHSTHPMDMFLNMLTSFDIQLLADVRRFAGSKRHPQFNPAVLETALLQSGISYMPFPELGGRRQPVADSKNSAWRVPAFRGYADYMETEAFVRSVELLEQSASEKRTAFMCAEAPWWRCHRSLISDFLKTRNWKVMHIMKLGKAEEHPFTSAATIVDGKLDYSNNSLKF